MSGKAVDWPVVRMNPEEFEAIKDQISSELNHPHTFPVPLSGKDSHGDIDVIVAEEDWDKVQLPDWVRAETRRNGFTHCARPLPDGAYVQVDFILVPFECLDMARLYYSHGTLSNHIGMLCRSVGLQFGHHGLRSRVHDPDTGERVGYVNVWHKPKDALMLLGLPEEDINHLLKGSFRTREEL